MHRFFLEENDIVTEQHIEIRNCETYKHLAKVLRIRIGEEVEFIGNNMVYQTQIIALNVQTIEAEILVQNALENESPVSIDLFQCLPKGSKLELILQKNVELGVNGFVLVKSKRCIVDFTDKDIPKKMARFERIVKDASKQSKRDFIPSIKGVFNLEETINTLKNYDLFLVLYENEEQYSVKNALNAFSGEKIGILVGPEGGFESHEIEKLKQNGAKIVTLGKRILRTETAGFVAVTCVQYEMNAFE